MTRVLQSRAVATAVGLCVLAAACQGGGPSEVVGELSPDQTLSYPIEQDVVTFDPALMDGVDPVARNLFSGLYKYDDHLDLMPDIAQGLPSAPDGRTFTFYVRHDVRFSNGDPVTAADVVYSWNRAAAKQGDFAGVFAPVIGYADVAAGKSKALAGLSVTDDYTVVVQLSQPYGGWVTRLGLAVTWIVDRKVIAAKGEDAWWTTPEGLIGTGPFALRARTPKHSLEFAPVPNWWGGSTGTLKKVHLGVVGDIHDQLNEYRNGQSDIIGYGEFIRFPPDLPAVVQFARDPTRARELLVTPYLKTTWVAFNVLTGPFRSIEEGRLGRLAFSQSIDRRQLVDQACEGGTTCLAAAGGLITKGLAGYLGDNQDPNATFDPGAAQANYKRWDPDGSKVRDLKLSFSPAFRAIADNLRAQWKANLGVDVGLDQADAQTFSSRLRLKSYALVVRGWIADWNGPDDWFDFLFTAKASENGGYSNPRFDAAVRDADAKPSSQALPDYDRAGQILVGDVAYAALVYGVRGYLIKPYVRGAGGNALYEYSWAEIKILKH